MKTVTGCVALVALSLALVGCAPDLADSLPKNRPMTASPSASTSASPSVPASASPSASAPTVGPKVKVTVTLYFGKSSKNPAADCSKVYPIKRTLTTSDDKGTAALTALFAGPTASETKLGYTSWFSKATATALKGVAVKNGTAYVNMTDVTTIIPNASTSCGSAALLAQLGTTAKTATGATRALYAIEGDPEPFWEWLQMGCTSDNDQCDPEPFQP